MRGKGLLALLVLLLLLVVLAPYTFLPPLLESVVARTFQDQLGLERTPEVELESDPAPMMYAGSFSKALVSMEGVELGGVKTDKVGMELDPFNLNIVESVTSGTVSTEQPLSGRLQVELSEDNASSLAKTVLAVPVQDVELEEGQVILKLALGFGSPVSVRGPLQAAEGRRGPAGCLDPAAARGVELCVPGNGAAVRRAHHRRGGSKRSPGPLR